LAGWKALLGTSKALDLIELLLFIDVLLIVEHLCRMSDEDENDKHKTTIFSSALECERRELMKVRRCLS
jgi:hypothetical protein